MSAGVGDLKKIFTRVNTSGVVGEVFLKAIVGQVLRAEQYGENVAVAGTAERVEIAVKLPGRDDAPLWLPIDSKFPVAVYQRLVDAADRGDSAAVDLGRKELEARLKQCARDICRKYVRPPATTDFAVLFLPTESLYAETLRNPGLAETLQRDYKVTVAGPTTLGALLTSLQMGFQTLAVQQRSGEVWKLLGAVKADFRKYAELLIKARRKLEEAGDAIHEAETRAQAIERKLRSVEEAPESVAAASANGAAR
jgi:DNA recombination protein RmuC